MDYKQYASKMREYIEEAMQVKESYDHAKEGIIEEYEARKKVFNNVEERFKQAEEGFNRGEVAKTTFNKLKKEYLRAKNTIQDLSAKLDEIDQFMNVRLDVILENLETMKQKYNEEINKETAKLKYQMIKAKYDFLNSAIEIRESYRTLRKGEFDLQSLSEEIGPRSVLTEKNAFQFLSEAVMDESGTAITTDELYDALRKGKISSELEENINYAKEQGHI